MLLIALGCGDPDQPEFAASFVAHCLGVGDNGDLTQDHPVMCWLDARGETAAVSDIELERGVPFIVDSTSGRVLATSRSGDLIDITVNITEGRPQRVAAADPDSAYGFAASSQLIRLTRDGELRSADDELLITFDLDGFVDVKSGLDVHGDEIAFTVERASGGFAVLAGDISSGSTREIFASSLYVGSARWSPDGSQVTLTGPDYRSVVVVRSDGELVRSLALDDARLSGKVTGPRWIDNNTVAYYDAAMALLIGDVPTGKVELTKLYELDGRYEVVPVLPVPLPV